MKRFLLGLTVTAALMLAAPAQALVGHPGCDPAGLHHAWAHWQKVGQTHSPDSKAWRHAEARFMARYYACSGPPPR